MVWTQCRCITQRCNAARKSDTSKFYCSPPTLEQSTSLTQRIYLQDHETHFSVLLTGLSPVLAKLPLDLVPAVTLLTDSHDDILVLQDAFAQAWQTAILDLPVPALTILTSKSFLSLDERIKSPTLDVDLILIHQTQGGIRTVMCWQPCC